MIIAYPKDGRGLLYHILDLNGQTVHAYRDFDAALRAREGDQRIAILQEPVNGRENRWLTGAPAPDLGTIHEALKLARSYLGAVIADDCDPEVASEALERILARLNLWRGVRP